MRRSLLLALLALLLVVGAAACGGAEDETASPDEVMTEPGDTGGTTTDDGTETDGETTTGTTTDGGEGGEGDAAAGKQVFASAGCGDCHVLADAGAEGNIGPNLDDAEPDFDLVVDRVTNGQGAMPSFKDDLSEDDINNVAAYVSESAGG